MKWIRLNKLNTISGKIRSGTGAFKLFCDNVYKIKKQMSITVRLKCEM